MTKSYSWYTLMTVKTSISLTDPLHAAAMRLVEDGAYPHLSALVQQALRGLLAAEAERTARLALLREELKARMAEPGVYKAEDVFDEIEADPEAALRRGAKASRWAVE
jgi:Arc/MetJ-type ribon-helix-helix transcriptional regulator